MFGMRAHRLLVQGAEAQQIGYAARAVGTVAAALAVVVLISGFVTVKRRAQVRPVPTYRCGCSGCWACKGYELECTCDVDWDAMFEALH